MQGLTRVELLVPYGDGDRSRSFTRSLVISSAKIARTAFSFGLSFLPGSPSDSRTSPSTDPYEAEPAPETAEGGLNSSVDPLRFIRLSEAATIPTRAHDTDAGLDLYAAEDARIGPGQRASVGTGLAIAVPEGLAGLVLPRSGLALKHGITLVNSPGLIDPGYRGEVRVLLLNTDTSSEFELPPATGRPAGPRPDRLRQPE